MGAGTGEQRPEYPPRRAEEAMVPGGGGSGHAEQGRDQPDGVGASPGVTLPSPVADAAALGLSALAQVVTRTQDGITVVDAERRWVYANPAACQILDRPLDQLRGENFLSGVPHDEREVVSSTFVIDLAGKPYEVAILRDLTGPRAAARTAVALAQTAAQLVGTATTNEILAGIARHACEGTRALSAGIAVMGEDHKLALGGGYGPGGPNYGDASPAWIALTDAPGEDVIEAMTAGLIIVGSVPGQAVAIPDARSAWEASPVMRGFAATMQGDDWQGAICVPLAWENRVIGLLGVYLPTGMAGPSEAELAFCTALADQAAVAVANARLTVQAGHAAALRERGRLARELHDSVSQALFSMTMHARAAQLSMANAGLDDAAPLGRSIAQLAELARGTLAEMRALIFELRPEALAEEGLVGALRKQGAALAAREQVLITVQGPDQPLGLNAEAEEHLYRIASEALHNVVKHARAGSAAVSVTTGEDTIRVTVSDDGAGFDPAVKHAGHLGLSTMAQRAEAIGADLTITSTPGAGTTVTLAVPATIRDPRRAG
jgi:PAS domain S-box-containing protein